VVVEGPRDNNVGNMHPLSIAKMLSQLKLQNVRGPLRNGKNKIIIEFSNAEAANSFVSHSELASKGYNLYIPEYNVCSKSIIRGVQFDFTLEEILNNIQSTVDILKVVRFNRRSLNEKKEVVFVKTGTCLLTFSGKSIPKSINLYGVEMEVENYIMPVTQFFNCFLFGHTKKQCRGKPKCAKCSDQGHSEDDCTKDFRCVNCGNNHRSINKECLEYKRQKQIKIYMSVDRISFYEADKMLPQIKKSSFSRQARNFPNLRERDGKNVQGFSQVSNNRDVYKKSKNR